MGTPVNFLVFCWAIGVRLSVVGDSVRYEAEAELVSDELIEVIRQHKEPLHYLLSGLADGTITENDIHAAYDLEVSQWK
jgi:hypothetical protein